MGNYGMKRWLVVQLANAGFILSSGGYLWCVQTLGEITIILIFLVPFMQYYCLRIALFPSRNSLPTGLVPKDYDPDISSAFLLVVLFFLNLWIANPLESDSGYSDKNELTLQKVVLFGGGGYWILHFIFLIPFTVKSIGLTFHRGIESEGSSMQTGYRLSTAKLVIASIVTLLVGYRAFDPSGDGETWLLSTFLGLLTYTVAIYKRTGNAAERYSLALGVLAAIIYTAFDQFQESSQQHSNLTMVTHAGIACVLVFGNGFILFFLFPKILSLFGLEDSLTNFLKNLLSTQKRRRRAKQREEAKQQVAELHASNSHEAEKVLLDCAPPQALASISERLADVQTVFQNLPGNRDFHLAASQLHVIVYDDGQPHQDAGHVYAYYRPFLVRYYTARLHAGEEPSNLQESCRKFLGELHRQHMVVDIETETQRIRTQSEWDLKQTETENNEERRREDQRRRDEDDYNSTVAELNLRHEEIKAIKTHSTLATHEREAALEKCFQDEQRLRNRISSLRERHPEFREENTAN